MFNVDSWFSSIRKRELNLILNCTLYSMNFWIQRQV